VAWAATSSAASAPGCEARPAWPAAADANSSSAAASGAPASCRLRLDLDLLLTPASSSARSAAVSSGSAVLAPWRAADSTWASAPDLSFSY
jgi:hypothetical protein